MKFCELKSLKWHQIGQLAIILALGVGLNACIYVSQPFTKSKAMEDLPADKSVIVSVTHVGKKTVPKRAASGTSISTLSTLWLKIRDIWGINCGFACSPAKRTMTVWEDRAALSQFVFGDVHDTAVMEAMSAVADGRSFTASVSVDQLSLSWSDAENYG